MVLGAEGEAGVDGDQEDGKGDLDESEPRGEAAVRKAWGRREDERGRSREANTKRRLHRRAAHDSPYPTSSAARFRSIGASTHWGSISLPWYHKSPGGSRKGREHLERSGSLWQPVLHRPAPARLGERYFR